MIPRPNSLPTAPELSLREKIGQLVCVRIGSNMPPVRRVEDDAERVEQLLETCPVGGLILFNGGPQTKSTLERMQNASRIPLLVGADIERGVGQQVKGYTLFPHAMAFDSLGAEAARVVGQFAAVLAEEARDVGIHITFGPIVDVNTHPKNPIIATRAFSEQTARVAELGAAYVRAAEAAGLLTCAKHFPGHGHTHKDSHDSLPVVTRSRDELAACELVPFEAAIDAGCSLVMTSHVSYPALDASGAPATISPDISTNLLREEMGFRGAVCSDSLLMSGVRDRFSSEPEMALATVAAGVDLLLDLEDPERVVDFLCDCVDTDRLSEQRVDEALERIAALKRKAFANRQHDVGVSRDAAESLAKTVGRKAIRTFSTHGSGVLPMDPKKPLVAVLLKPFETLIDPPEQPLAAALRERFARATYLQLGPKADEAAYRAAYDAARSADQLLIATTVRPAAWHAFGLRPEQQRFLQDLASTRPLVLASLGIPYILEDYPMAAARVCAYSDVPVSQQALADFLAGR